MQFNGRVALITGSGDGIGKGIAERLSKLGVTVVINDINDAKIAQVVQAIKDNGKEAWGKVADVTQLNEVEELFKGIIDRYKRIDILVNNAGIAKDKSIRKMTMDDWDKVLSVNLTGTFICSKVAAQYMTEQGYGRIINIASRAWLGGPGQANYSASKGGIVSLTRTLSLELGKKGITANCIAPGLIETPLLNSVSEEVRQRLLMAQPTGKVGSVQDVAHAVAFFAADDAHYITGQTMFVCGGKSLFADIL